MVLSDEELGIVAKALGKFADYLQTEHTMLINRQGDLPDVVYQAAFNILQEHIAPVTDLQTRIAKHFGYPNMPTG